MKSSLEERKMRNSSNRMICAAIAGAAIAALPAAAEAKPSKPVAPKQAKFRATLSGSQVTTWEYHKPDDKNNPCDASADGFGDQSVKFDAGGEFDLAFYQPTRKQPNLFSTQGRPAVLPGRVAVAATAERGGEFAVHLSDIDQNRCDGQNGGGADPGTPKPKDCGVRSGIFRADLFFHFGPGEQALFVPLPGGIPAERNSLKVAAEGADWRGAGGRHEGYLDDTYTNCPFMLGDEKRVEESGLIFTSAGKVNENLLFDRKRKRITVSGSTIVNRSAPYTTGKTIVAWNLRLRRVK
jgi:hypothetical protein